jgi:hypothetical protein
MQTQTFLFLMLAEKIGFDRYSTNNKATILDLNNHRGMREIKPAYM